MSEATELIATQLGSAISNQRTWGTIIYNVKDPQYGAKGDGVSYDSTAIQSAINAAAVKGGTVIFPPGSYGINAIITVPYNVILQGSGTASILYAPITIDTMVSLKGAIKDLRFNGNNKASKGISLDGSYCYLEKCVFEYCVYGIYNNGFDDHRLMNISTQNCTYGVYSADRLINCFIYGMVAQNNQYGIYVTYSVQQPQSLFITQSMFFGNSVRGVYVHKDIFVLCITDCVFDGVQPRGIMLNDLTANLGADITIKNCYIGATEAPVWIGAGYGHVVIDSNRIDNGSYRGLVISAIASVRNSNVTITSNSFGNNGGGDISIDSVDGCWIERNVFGMVSGTNIISAGTFTGTKPFAIVKENNFPAPGRASTFNTRFLDNLGYVTSNQGLGAIGNTFTSVVINHGMDIAPTRVFVTPQGNLGNVWVTNITATQFTVNCSTASVGVTQFSWFAQDKY